MTCRLILASQSPRRRELLKQITPDYVVDVADINEDPLGDEPAHDYVVRLALAKAQAVWLRRGDKLPVLGSDTTVALDDHILGKPIDNTDALTMLKRLNGRSHEVLTAVALVTEHGVFQRLSCTTVTFAQQSDASLEAYVASGEPLDKAGSYGIQGHAGLFVSHLSGSFTGVMGLPLFETAQLLAEAGIITV
jgi:septum formation protein